MLMQLNWQDLSPEEKVELIKRHHTSRSTGGILADAISGICGHRVTRQMVLSVYSRRPELNTTHPLKTHRSNVKKITPTSFGTRDEAVYMTPSPYSVVGFTREEAAAYDATARGLTLMQIGYGQCRWPVGTNRFCGHHSGIHTYCSHHRIRNRVVQ